MDGGAWWAAVHGIAKSRARMSNFTFTFHFHALEKEMATHSSVLVWRIPGTGEPGGWNFPDKNTGVGCHFLLQRIFPKSGSEPMSSVSPALQTDSLLLSHHGSPEKAMVFAQSLSHV